MADIDDGGAKELKEREGEGHGGGEGLRAEEESVDCCSGREIDSTGRARRGWFEQAQRWQ